MQFFIYKRYNYQYYFVGELQGQIIDNSKVNLSII